jgi:carbohydrate-binding DOMON domain-containing protein
MAMELGAALRVLDVDDPEQAKVGDSLVERYGDHVDDYLVPQVFFEEDGKMQHVFTGFSEGVEVTRARWDDFFVSQFYRNKLREQS